MRKTRSLVAVTLLATALCADRSVAAAAGTAGQGSSRATEAGPVGRGFAERLTISLRRVVPTVKLDQRGQAGVPAAEFRPAFEGPQASVHGVEGTPFQFRLPPPVC